jgi:serine-type D-Ala-D-Ala endopeptidase (penicillin-binding protein 7)
MQSSLFILVVVCAMWLGAAVAAPAQKSEAELENPVAAGKLSVGKASGLHAVPDLLDLKSSVAFVVDQKTGRIVFEKNSQAVLPIASLTKLMTAMVVLDARQLLNEPLEITQADVDVEKFSRSRLRVGSRLTRSEMLQVALMASENRAAATLGRNYPGGMIAFVAAMNAKASALKMQASSFADPTGLSSENISTARDLYKLMQAAGSYPLIKRYSTATELSVDTGMRQITFGNTNRLLQSADWQFSLSKTGFINEAGNCLVMQAVVDGRHLSFVFLDSFGKYSRLGDVQRIRKWLQAGSALKATGA